MISLVTPQDAAIEVQRRRKARKSYIDYLRYVWWMPHPLVIGRHTIEICAALDKAIDDYLAGIPTVMDIKVPFRHGKSDMVSRAFPPYFLARCFMDKLENDGEGKDPDVIMSGYGADLVEGFSKDAQDIISSSSFKALFPKVKLRKGRCTVSEWRIDGSSGKIIAAGLEGGISGKGGDLVILDDHTKKRKEARSKTYRKNSWESFTQSLFTRRAPVSIFIVCATPWDVDDIQGRIKKKEKAGKGFPKFKRLTFPARNKPEDVPKYGEFLFSDRFSDQWYLEQYAVLQKGADGLLDCCPVADGGNRFAVDNVREYDSAESWPEVRWVRAWDLASSSKERDSDDPDWTVGMLGGVTYVKTDVGESSIEVPHLWIKDAVFVRAEAPERDRLIKKTAIADGGGVSQIIEAFGAYKDAYTTLKKLLRGVSTVKRSQMPGDKSAKAAPLEPIFDAGNVHILRGDWNELFFDHFRAFPDGDHDDMVDPAAIIQNEFVRPKVSMVF